MLFAIYPQMHMVLFSLLIKRIALQACYTDIFKYLMHIDKNKNKMEKNHVAYKI